MKTTPLENGILTAFILVFSYLYNSIGVIFVVLLLSMLIDYMTGLALAYSNKEINSKQGFIGIVKKTSYIGLVIVAILFDVALLHAIDYLNEYLNLTLSLPLDNTFGVLVPTWLFFNEAISIVENLIGLGVPVPMFLSKGLKVFRAKIDNLNVINDEDISEINTKEDKKK